jgi:pantoate--beta-alanine ligase
VETIIETACAELEDPLIQTEYFQIVNPATLQPMSSISGPALALVAARVGGVRLIDNQPLSTDPTSSRPPVAAGSNTRSD